jgi:putative transposase
LPLRDTDPSLTLAEELAVGQSNDQNSEMAKRRILDEERHAQFVTFACYRRRRMLDTDQLRDALIGLLVTKLADYRGICSGFVVMPDHVHLIVWFSEVDRLSTFMKSWKQTSSMKLKRMLRGVAPHYAETIPFQEPFWQPKYYPFNLYSDKKAREKLDYMHHNPVGSGLVDSAIEWRWSSARHYVLGEPCAVPLEWIF